MDDYQPYISAAERRRQAQAALQKLQQEGYDLQPIEPFGGAKIANTFWGHGWCRHLEQFSDYANRLPRGRSYLRHGSVAHLEIAPGRVDAIVLGSERYELQVNIAPLAASKWAALKQRCSGKIGSLVELLQGKLSHEVMRLVTDPSDGLYPLPAEIRLSCDCPDYADLCKHLAAALYGIGRRLDQQPELLFTLRGVDQSELVATTLPQAPGTARRRIPVSALGHVFGIDLDPSASPLPDAGLDLGPDRTAPSPSLTEQKPTNPSPRTQKNKPCTQKHTGAQVAQLRERFGMTQYEFALIAQATPATVRNWEAKGDAPLRLRAPNAAALEALAALSSEAAWDRLNALI